MSYQKLKRLIKIFREIPDLPVNYIHCLIEIENNEGLSLTSLAEKLDLQMPTVSRIISNLEDRGKAYGLVESIRDPKSRRSKKVYLTNRGKSFTRKITSAVE